MSIESCRIGTFELNISGNQANFALVDTKFVQKPSISRPDGLPATG